MGHISMCGPKGCSVLAFLVRDRVPILAILVLNRVRSLHSSLGLGMFFLEEATFSSLSMRPSTKALHNAFDIGLNCVTN